MQAPEYVTPAPETPPPGTVVLTERQALTELLSRIHRVNNFGMEIGAVAQVNAGSDEVRQLANDVANHRAQLDAKVQSLAQREGIELVEPTPMSEADRQVMTLQNALVQELRDLKGAEFDQLYLTSTAVSRAEVLPIIRDLADDITDQEIRAMLANSIPVLEQEYARALTILSTHKEMEQKVGQR